MGGEGSNSSAGDLIITSHDNGSIYNKKIIKRIHLLFCQSHRELTISAKAVVTSR